MHDYTIEQNVDGRWYVLQGNYTLADVPRWQHDGSHDRNSVAPDPALDWIDGPYSSEQAAEAAARSLAES